MKRDRISAQKLTHHQATVALWEAIGREMCPCPPGRADRRGQPRFLARGVPCRLSVDHSGSRHSLPVEVQDVGPGGASLICGEAVGPSDSALLIPPVELRGRSPSVPADIVHCQPIGDHFRIGVTFRAHPR